MKGTLTGLLAASLLCAYGCMEQYNPRPFWQKLEEERQIAAHPHSKLTAEGKLPAGVGGGAAAAKSAAFNPQQAFTSYCVACHGPGGDAKINNSRDLADPAWQAEATDEQIKAVIEFGAVAAATKADFSKRSAAYKVSNPLMTPWGSLIVVPGSNAAEKDEQLQAMVNYVRSLKKKK